MSKETQREVEHFISSNFGKKIVCPKITDEFQEIANFEIDPKTLGPFGLCIRDMQVKIRVAEYTGATTNTYLELDYRYNHCRRIDIEGVKDDLGGGNGYRVEIIL
jgi:hypothetical protein